ncbi:LuxR family transcriptional regulator [Rhodococcus sp. BP-349]|nr:LuxR family transcriptional regulator [Rhodococcus sp. BP-363]MBY6542189.1 LuxR family transcriptional regulator [Rhodococcus sp. BP-369]MBY6561419.1 LuxR family transcriptional regulator [Rhodococcus sp. BP-370]MBY6575711.1 LuxR family transcriptional regulator [Rhodococcus sp. BP-364]MBY6585012.1 LuxR family transcriptional regulator [Rhodococcus sp. BP-358]MBY6589349.1 LuxR family transcriptional regulator [Rhodococcus sp. BP-362]MBY6594118.1 LuxR family transcriptional regulator [Rhodo
MTSFIGRRKEIDEAHVRLQQSRLVTLLGPGGVGKTRLAERIAERTSRAFRDSYRWIDLASVRDPEALTSTAAAALGVIDQSNKDTMDKTLDYLRDKHVLIVLDNCEHLLEASAQFVASILAGTPEAHILATSRAPLGVGGETTFDLPPLSTPPPLPTGYAAADVAVYESVRLLVERAQAIFTGFELNDSNANDIAELCSQLDGIPLAIELAAVRLRSLSPSQLTRRLDHRFALLTGGDRSSMPRQQTLRALIDWSYDLCSDAERVLWARLSVFSGSLDLEAAEQVCSGGVVSESGVIETLDGLIAQSLVSVDRSAAELRYSQLMTVREYGHELLETSGDSAAVYSRHRDHYVTKAQEFADDWFSPRQSQHLGLLRVDHDNLMSALDWSLRNGDFHSAAALSVALRYHWIAGGYLSDGRLRLERVLARLLSDESRGDVLWVAAWTALIQGDRDGALAHLNECSAIADRLGDSRLQSHRDHWAGLHALFSGHTSEAIALLSRAVDVHRAQDDKASLLTASFMLAMAQAYDGQLEQSLITCDDVVAIADGHGEQWNKAYALWVSSVARFHLGETEHAISAAHKALGIQRDFKDKICTALSIEVLVWSAQAVGESEHAAELCGAASSVWKLLGTSVAAFGPHVERDSTTSMSAVQHALGISVFERIRNKTSGLNIVESVGLALGTKPYRSDSVDSPASVLTKREVQVAGLLAEGLGNRDIADKLVISRRTVDGHVERIFTKLGVGSRTQVAVWIRANGAADQNDAANTNTSGRAD